MLLHLLLLLLLLLLHLLLLHLLLLLLHLLLLHLLLLCLLLLVWLMHCSVWPLPQLLLVPLSVTLPRRTPSCLCQWLHVLLLRAWQCRLLMCLRYMSCPLTLHRPLSCPLTAHACTSFPLLQGLLTTPSAPLS